MIHFLILLLSFLGEANASTPIPANYQMKAAQPVSVESSTSVLRAMSAIFDQRGFSVLDPSMTGEIPFFNVDQVYSDLFNHQAVFVKMNFAPTRSEDENQFFKVNDDTRFVQSETDQHLKYTLVFYKVPEAKAQEMFQAIQTCLKQLPREKTARVEMVSTANAGEPVPNCLLCNQRRQQEQAPASSTQSIASLQNNLQCSTAADSIQTCFGGLLKGAWASTGGLVSSVAGATVDFAKDPVGSMKSLGVKAEQLWKFASDLPVQLQKAWTGFRNLAPEVQTEIGCELLGGLGIDVVIGVMTGGLASAKGALMLKKIADISKRLAQLDKFVGFLAKTKEVGTKLLRRKLFRRLTEGSIEENQLGAITTFSDQKLMNLAVGAAECAL